MIWLGELPQGPSFEGWPFLPPKAQGDTWLVTSPECPTPWQGLLETACSTIMIWESNAVMKAGRGLTFKGWWEKFHQMSLLLEEKRPFFIHYKHRVCLSGGIHYEETFLAHRIGDLAFNLSPKEKNLNIAWDFIRVVLGQSIGSGGGVGVKPV